MKNYYALCKTSLLINIKFQRFFAALFTVTFALFLMPKAQATHYSSGEIFYEWIGNEPGRSSLAYRVYVTIFRNTSGINIGTRNLNGCAEPNNGAASSINFTLQYQNPSTALLPQYRITPTNPYGWEDTGVHPNDPDGWAMPNANICAVTNKTISEYRYVGEVILSTFSTDWTFAVFPPCCRDQNDNLSGSGSLYLSAELNGTRNSSPRILSFTQFALCVISDSARPHHLNLRARDGDGDSLFYQFAPEGSLAGNRCGNTSKLAYAANFSPSNPFPNHRPPFFDQPKAQLIFSPSLAGSYVVKLEVLDLRTDTNGNLINVGNTTLEFQMNIATTCKIPRSNFISTRDTLLKRKCGDSTFTINNKKRLDISTVEPSASDFALITSQNTLVPLQSVRLLNGKDFFITLHDTLSINDTMTLVIRQGLDSNTVFDICGNPFKDKDTLATIISSGCKIDTTSGVGLPQLQADLLSLYPNPGKDVVRLKAPIHLDQSAYALINATGAVISRGTLPSAASHIISTAHLKPGVYWIRLQNKNFTAVKKFIKK